MQKVVIVTNIPAPYRVELFYYMQTHLCEQYDIHVVYTSETEGNRNWAVPTEKMLQSTVLQSKVIQKKTAHDTRFIHLPANIAKVLSRIAPDIVIAFEYNPAALQSLLWCKLHCKKFIHLTDGTLTSEREVGRVQRLARKLVTKQADACIASSTKAKEKLLAYRVPAEKIFVSLLTFAFDTQQKRVGDLQSGRILYVGSMAERKGLDLLIDALPHLQSQWQLHIVGNGTPQEIAQLTQQAQAAGVGEQIVWRGYQEGEEMAKEYQESQVFVLPTREDCFGLVLLEALSQGVPIVSSQYADGAYDVIATEQDGTVVDPYNAHALAKAIDHYLAADALPARKFSKNLDKFAFVQVVKGYISAIEHVVE